MFVYHNSHDLNCREPFGAVPLNAELHIALEVREAPANLQCILRLWIEGQGEQRLLMDSVDGIHYEATFHVPTEPTLIWYFFLLETEQSAQYYGNISQLGGTGSLFDHEPPAWQITVYRPSTLPEWYRNGICYQIFPDRFARGADWLECWYSASHPDNWVGPPRLLHQSWHDTPFYTRNASNQVTRWDFFGGTLSGIMEHLLYLRSLGITSIYLNPIFTASSNHKYDTADYYHVDPGFGGDEAFTQLVQAANACGIHLILDGVFSHTGMDSIYFNRNGNYGSGGAYRDAHSPYRAWYHLEPDGTYDSWWGVEDLPNVEELNPSYEDMIHRSTDSVIRHWLRAGASGWRLDVADELPDTFIAGIRTAIQETNPEALLMGEVWEDASHKESYGRRRRYFSGDELDCTMHYPFRTAATDFMLGKLDAASFCAQMRSIQENYPPSAFYGALNLIGSHDRPRILTLMGDAPADLSEAEKEVYRLDETQRWRAIHRVKLLSLLQFTAPGVPCIYYGDEAGMEGYDDPFNRAPYPWGNENEELQSHYRTLTQLRQAHPVLVDGDFLPLSFGPHVYGCLRSQADESILTLVNRDLEHAQEIRYATEASFAVELLTGRVLPIADGFVTLQLPPLGGVCLCLKAQAPVLEPMGRKAGVLCPVFSLPGPHVTGTLGEDARGFLRYLHRAGQQIWQILPLNPVGLGNSPYSSPAVFAGDRRFIDPEEPVEEARYADWCQDNAYWVNDYALFMALHDHYNLPWQQWPADAKQRTDLAALTAAHAEAVERYRHEQFVFWQQWDALRNYAHSLNIEIVGDVPIYVSEDSVDLWAHPEQFLLDADGYPSFGAGCPPDYFSAEGQNWKNPLYNWEVMESDGYRWWGERLKHCVHHLDAVRVDHFRAFSAYFAIPTGKLPKDGQWLKGPGLPFWERMRQELGQLPILAEDLGDLDAGVYSLLAETGLPGMSVWQFHASEIQSMDPDLAKHRAFYTGTHDNQTLLGWLADTTPQSNPEDAAQAIVEALYRSAGAWAILPLQDMLGLGDEARINTPGTVGDNWSWRCSWPQLQENKADWLRKLAEQSGR